MNKKTYNSPQIHKYGTIAELTQTNTQDIGNGNDGGNFPNFYNS